LELTASQKQQIKEAEKQLTAGNGKKSLEIWNSLLSKDPKPIFWLGKAKCLNNLGQLKEAIEASNEALKLKPKYGPAHLLLGILLCCKGEDEKSVQSFQTALKFATSADVKEDATARMTEPLLRLGRIKEAIQCANTSIKSSNPQNQLIGYITKSLAVQESSERGNWIEAIAEITPNSYQSHRLKTEFLLRSEYFDDAVDAYDEAISQYGSVDFFSYGKAEALLRLKKYKEAFQWYEKAEKEGYNNSDILIGKGLSLLLMGKCDEAQKHFETALNSVTNLEVKQQILQLMGAALDCS